MIYQKDNRPFYIKFPRRLMVKILSYIMHKRIKIVFLAYPKTGNTWTITMLRHYIVKHYNLSEKYLGKCMLSDYTYNEFYKLPLKIPEIFHTHACIFLGKKMNINDLTKEFEKYKDKNMIILIRDFKDVLTSQFMHDVHRSNQRRFFGNISEYIVSEEFGIEKIVSYYNVLFKIRKFSNKKTILVSYEEFFKNTENKLKDFIKYTLGKKNIDSELIKETVKFGNIKNMRKLEKQANNQNEAIIPGLFLSGDKSKNAYKARKGGSGKHKEIMSKNNVGYIDKFIKKKISIFSDYINLTNIKR